MAADSNLGESQHGGQENALDVRRHFAVLGRKQVVHLPEGLEVDCVPVLFAGDAAQSIEGNARGAALPAGSYTRVRLMVGRPGPLKCTLTTSCLPFLSERE